MTHRHRHVRPALAGALAMSLLLGLAGTAAAHAELVEVTPEADSTVQGTPAEIVAVFTAALEADGTSFELRDAEGDEIATGGIDPEDETRLVIDPVPDLAPGAYKVFWVAASDDGHIERDTWTFTVEAAVTPAPTPTAEVTVAPTDAPSEQPSPSLSAAPSEAAGSPSGSPADPADPAAATSEMLIPILVLAALVGIGMTYLLRRRSGPAA